MIIWVSVARKTDELGFLSEYWKIVSWKVSLYIAPTHESTHSGFKNIMQTQIAEEKGHS